MPRTPDLPDRPRPGPVRLRLVTEDTGLSHRLTGLAAAAGVQLEVVPRLAAGWSRRSDIALVLVDVEAEVPTERRPGVVLVCADRLGDDPAPHTWRRAVELGAEQVVVLPVGESWLLDRILDAAVPAVMAPVVGVIGGRGGAGASTLAVGLAAVAARGGLRTLLVDADPLGGGLDLLVGVEQEPGLRWDDLAGARGRLQPRALTSMLPSAGSLAVLSWGRRMVDPARSPGGGPDLLGAGWLPEGAPGAAPPTEAADRARSGPAHGDPGPRGGGPGGKAFGEEGWSGSGSGSGPVAPVLQVPVPEVPVLDGSRGGDVLIERGGPSPGHGAADGAGFGPRALHPDAVNAVLRSAVREFGLVVVDLSRRFAPADLAALQACRTVLLTVPAEVRATAAATAVSVLLDEVVADQRLVVRGPAPAGLPAEAVADALGLPLAGRLRSEPAVAAALDRGEPLPSRHRGALTVLSRRLLAEVLAA